MDIPDTLGDAEDLMTMLLAEKTMLRRRKASKRLKKGDAARLRELGRQIARLDKRVGELMLAQRDKDDVARVKMENQGAVFLPNTPAVQAGTKRKRNSGSPRKAGAIGKKAKRPAGASAAPTRGKRSKAAKESIEIILGMLQAGDCLTAGHDMADSPLLQGVKATTIRDQNKQLRGLASTLSGADRKQIRGDNIMIMKARAALKRRYQAADEKFLIKGMRTALLPYQFAAVGWMVQREHEKSDELPGGGLLADTMGLGKTVQALACVCGNPPSEEDRLARRDITLVVAPANAIQQWLGEISRHCVGINSCQYKLSDGIDLDTRKNNTIW